MRRLKEKMVDQEDLYMVLKSFWRVCPAHHYPWVAAVPEGLKGESSLADICRKYQISEDFYMVCQKFLSLIPFPPGGGRGLG